MIYDLIIVGGGAAGLACANVAKSRGLSFIILEAASRVGRKILATGNGRCNLSNICINSKYYNDDFVKGILSRYSTQEIVAFFKNLGLRSKEIDGKIYPHTESANTVLNFLRAGISKNIICNYLVKDIKKESEFVINNQYTSKNVLVTTGSNATLGTNSLSLLEKLGHSYQPFIPSLVWLNTEKTYIKGLSGIRTKAIAYLYQNDKRVATEQGEVLFKDSGISGIAIFMLSAYIARNKNKGDFTIKLDLAPDLDEKQVLDYKLKGLVRERIALHIEQQARDKGQSIPYTLKNFHIKVMDLGDMKHAQVACGGYLTTEFEEKSLQSKLVENLYVAGEALNIDGQCGGYNLHWAWASGMTVGYTI